MSGCDEGSGSLPGWIVQEVYDELRSLARFHVRRQASDFTLTPTEIVNEALLYFLKQTAQKWHDPRQFRAVVSAKLRHVVLDHVKHRIAQKRGGRGRDAGGQAGATRFNRLSIDAVDVQWDDRSIAIDDLSGALADLHHDRPDLGNLVLIHWFGGLTCEQIGQAVGISGTMVRRKLHYANAWLRRRLEGGAAGERDSSCAGSAGPGAPR